MGADMALVLVERTVTYDKAKARLKNLDNKKIGRLWYHGDEPDPDDTTDFISELEMDLSLVYEYSRETIEYHIGDIVLIATGGLSWGDAPTEAYDPLCRIDELCITLSDEKWNGIKEFWEKD